MATSKKVGLYWKSMNPTYKITRCELCPHFCVLKNGDRGKCGVRENFNGKIISLVYGKPISTNLDPIEKKPLYHFMPGSKTFSFGTVGCNLKCLFCQNSEISQASPEEYPIASISPQKIVISAKKEDSSIISYTYTEPVVFYEYMLDTAKIANKKEMKNVMVSNGFINPIPLMDLVSFIQGVNIDLKSLENEFYENICQGKLEPVLATIKTLKEKGVWVELTNLVIPGKNDSLYEIRKLISWIKNELGVDMPLHFSAFYPCYKMRDISVTSPEILKKARKIAMDVGLRYVYTGNIDDNEGSNTYCPRCKKAVIIRQGYRIVENKLNKGKCLCGEEIAGVWE